ncbi:ABC-2 transporter permease [Lentilactobacillus hilgardii]|uniref:ABC-2 transporter permease n=1 Tax=Lentilactobacillus hilgardii TaxID=1588 RepID=UPI003FA58ED9
MNGLILKDVYSLEKLWFKKSYILAALILLVGSTIWLKESGSIISVIFLSMLLLNSLQTLFLDDSHSNWLLFLKTLNIPLSKVILSRYTIAFIISLIATIITFATALISRLFSSVMTITQLFEFSLIVLVISVIYIFFLIPFIYLFNQNGLIIGFLTIIALTFGIFKLFSIDALTVSIVNTSGYIIFLIVLGIIILDFSVSYAISFLIMKKKSFNG